MNEVKYSSLPSDTVPTKPVGLAIEVEGKSYRIIEDGTHIYLQETDPSGLFAYEED